ncbi:MAG TPA: thiamine-phosphate kinase [Novosphingobium sp.]|nr:thiamine-phosphate kinase [Novosphingobium sp.]
MTSEFAFIEALRAIATDPAARGLDDDAAVIEVGGENLVLTMDTMVEAVHFLPDDPAADVAWKLVAVNVSDLSAKGAKPIGCLVSYALGDSAWDRDFLAGLKQASLHFGIPLLGGDTVRMPDEAPRSFSLTAFGRGPNASVVPSRSGAMPGDRLWVSGTIGDAGLGLAILRKMPPSPEPVIAAAEWLAARYRRPAPVPSLGIALAPLVSAMMDVSDGLLVDARRMADASKAVLAIAADMVPLSDAALEVSGGDLAARMAAMTAGDDYCLLFAAPAERTASIRETAAGLGCDVTIIGEVRAGAGLALTLDGKPVTLPEKLGYEH